MSRQAFITGATGFVGGHVARELVREGWQVTALVRDNSSLRDIQDLGLELREGDVTDRESLQRAIPRGCDAVFHVAASTSIWSRRNAEQTRINLHGTRHVIEAARAAGVQRLVHTSTFAVWGFGDRVVTEETPRTTDSDWINYVASKHAAEEEVKHAAERGGLDAVIMNPAHVLGPGDRHNWSRMIRMVDEGSLPGVPPGGGAFGDVREIARAHVQAFHDGRRGANYLLGGEDVEFIDVIRVVGEILGKPVPSKPTPAWVLKAVARFNVARAAITGKEPDLTPEGAAMITRHMGCDSSRAQRELGYRFTPIRTLLEDTIRWMKREGLLK